MDFKNERLMMSEEEARNRAKELLNENQVDLITKYMFLEQQCKKQQEVIDKVIKLIKKTKERRYLLLQEIEILDILKEVVESLDELDRYIDSLSDSCSKNDQGISDLYHYIENNQLNSKSSYRMIKELKIRLVDRRKIKQEQELAHTLRTYQQRLIGYENRKLLLGEIGKTEKRLNTQYRYRVYNEDELREKMEA